LNYEKHQHAHDKRGHGTVMNNMMNEEKAPPMREDNELHILAEGKFVRLVKRGRWEWAERTNCSSAVVIVPVTREKELVFIEQYRPPIGANVIEFPAGLVGDEPDMSGEELLTAARRELTEETGFASDHWQFLLEGPSSPGLTNEAYAMFLATDAYRVGDGGGDETEEIAIHLVPLEKAEVWLREKRNAGTPVDPKVYAGLYFAFKDMIR
jgi:ADP-ribose pyrophosphatase